MSDFGVPDDDMSDSLPPHGGPDPFDGWDLEGLLSYLGHYFPIAPDTALPDSALRQGQAGLTDYLSQAAYEAYEAKESQIGDEVLCRSVERFVLLRTIDQKWIDYLTTMEHFREGIGLQAYGQRDPLVEYKIEAHKMFEELTEGIRADIVANMFRVQVTPQEAPPEPQPAYNGSASGGDGKAAASGPGEPVGVGAPNRKLGRNDLCWCGSGRKYKRCHGR